VYQELILIKIKSVFLFQDTLGRCCGFRGIKGHGTFRSYSILSRSAQRGVLGTSNAGQESTDYSGYSFREEALPSGPGSSGSSVKESSGTRRSFRKHEGSYLTGSRGQESNRVTSPSDQKRQSLSANISATQNSENVMVHQLNRQNKQVSQSPTLTKQPTDRNLKIRRKEKRNGGKGKKKKNIWNVFRSITSSANFVEENKKLSVSYSPTATTPNQYSLPPEVFGMLPVCDSRSVRSLSSSTNNVSNSSLRDVERGALEDELTAYMQELRRREEC